MKRTSICVGFREGLSLLASDLFYQINWLSMIKMTLMISVLEEASLRLVWKSREQTNNGGRDTWCWGTGKQRDSVITWLSYQHGRARSHSNQRSLGKADSQPPIGHLPGTSDAWRGGNWRFQIHPHVTGKAKIND